jgi:tetratricopeptide (TPR) repeat protein
MKQTPNGFIRETSNGQLNINSQQKVTLIRKANELFNQGKIEESKKIFLTLRYTDGIVRLGNYYYQKKRFAEALRMYAHAPESGRLQAMAPEIAKVIRIWLMSDKDR